MEIQRVSTGYSPRPQQEWLHAKLKRFNVLVCHRRLGKTVLAINEIIDRALRNPRRNPQYAYVAPTYSAAKRIAWDYLKEYCRTLQGATFNEAELRCDIPRGEDRVRIMLLGAENPDSLRGIYLDGVVLDEYAQVNPEIWTAVIRPALSDRMGWAIFISTPLGANHFFEIYRHARRSQDPEWFAALFRASETGIIPKKELEAARATMSREMFEQEFECSFTAALVGAYYKHEMRMAEEGNRITKVPYDPHALVHTGWDLGIDDSTAIWFMQMVGREPRAVDYMEVSGRGLPWIVSELNKKGYNYGTHFLPHDAAARELGTGKSREEVLRALGLKNVEVVKRHKVEDGIEAARALLSKMWFDRYNCDYGIEALKSYERQFDTKEGVFRAKPRHNWASHGADAMRTLAWGFRGPEEKRYSLDFPDRAQTEYDVMGW